MTRRGNGGPIGTFRAVSAITSGTVIGQFMIVAVSPLLTRLYDPDEFGTGAVFASLLAILSVGACLGIDQLVLATGSEADQQWVARRAVQAANVVGLASLPVGLLFFGLGWYGIALSMMLAVAVSAAGRFAALSQLAIAQGSYAQLGRRSAYLGGVQATTQAGLGAVWPTAVSLAFGQAAARCVSILTVRRLRWSYASLKDNPRPTLRRGSIGVSFSSSVIAALALQLPTIATSAVFGEDAAGQASLSQRVLGLPMTVIGTAVGQVFLGQITKHRTDPAIRRGITRRFIILLSLLGAVFSSVIIVAAPATFEWIFGDQWRASGDIARATALAVGSQLVGSPLSYALVPLGGGRQFLIFIITRLVFGVALFSSSFTFGWSLEVTFWIYGASLCIQNVWLTAIVWRVAVTRRSVIEAVRPEETDSE